MIDRIPGDLRLALRSLGKHARFSALAVAAFAVGIGSNVVIFSMVDDVLLDPLPFPSSDRLVLVWDRHPERGIDRIPAAPARFFEWREEPGVFASVGLWRTDAMDLAAEEGAERITVGQVFPEILPMLGRAPTRGRGFREEDLRPGAERVVVMTHRFWVERMGADPDLVGRSLTLDGEAHTVLGVTPPGEVFPADVDLYRPLVLENPASRAAHAYRVLARLAPGVSLDEARRRMAAAGERLAAAYPETDAGLTVTVEPLRDQIMGADTAASLLLLQGAVGLVLLIACGNVAGLLLVRAAGRRREMAVRSALGARRSHLVALQVTESVLLALGGGVVGLLLASGTVGALARLSPLDLGTGGASVMDGTVLTFTGVVSLAAGVAFGVVPALHATRGEVSSTLRGSGGTAAVGRARLRSAVVTAEVALATLVLVGSGLFLRSLDALGDVDPGFRAEGLLAAEVRPPSYRYPSADERYTLHRSLLEGLKGRPGVASVAVVSHLPMEGRTDHFRFQVEGRPPDRFADLSTAPLRAVSPGYFSTMGVRVLRGRGLTPADGPEAELVAVIGESAAERFWPGTDPLESRISFSGDEGPWARIVGVVEDVRHDGPAQEAGPALYVPLAQEPLPRVSLVLRTTADPLALVETVREAVRALDPMLPVASVRTLESLIDRAKAPWRFQAVLVSLFGSMAVLLTAIGGYGLLNYVVHERTVELGIRRALGARARHVRRLVARQAGILVALGVGLGLAGGALLSRAVRGMLFGVSPLDPVSYAGAAALLVGVGLLAMWLPTRRALAVDPMTALRPE